MANTYLSRTEADFGTATNRKKCTISFWVKRSLLTSQQAVMGVETTPAGGTSEARFILKGDDKLEIYDYQSGYKFRYITTRVLRDVNAWYHIVVAVDTTQGTASNRVKLYINGVQETSFSTESDPTLDLDTFLNSGSYVQIGRQSTGNSYLEGCINNYAFVDGTALTPTSFGETDSASGIWKFKTPSGVTWGTNGFHLKMDNSANLGLDSSGETNNFTLSGNGRQAKDTPTNVFATFNPLDVNKGTVTTFSNGNTTVMHNAGSSGSTTASRSTLAYSAGKFYWEAKCIATGGDVRTGIISMSSSDYNTQTNPFTLNECYNYKSNGDKGSCGDTNSAYGATYTAGDIIGIAHDVSAGTLIFYKNGVSQGTAFTGLSTSLFWGAFSSEYNQGKYSYNFGNGYFGTTAITSAGSNGNGSLFEYDVPSGYYALNTKNINTYG